MRQVLQQGSGILWERDRLGRLWLYSNGRVASNLEIERLTGKTVYLPITKLIGNIASVRAAFYASFHAGRKERPISRAALQSITGISERSQRTYDRLADVTVKTNIGLGYPVNNSNNDIKDFLYESGHGHFIFEDKKGRFGRKGQKYHARQLPNSYEASYLAIRSRGQKTLNNALGIDLATNEVLGNDLQSDKPNRRLYYPVAKKVMRHDSDPKRPVYTLDRQQGGVFVWNRW